MRKVYTYQIKCRKERLKKLRELHDRAAKAGCITKRIKREIDHIERELAFLEKFQKSLTDFL